MLPIVGHGLLLLLVHGMSGALNTSLSAVQACLRSQDCAAKEHLLLVCTYIQSCTLGSCTALAESACGFHEMTFITNRSVSASHHVRL